METRTEFPVHKIIGSVPPTINVAVIRVEFAFTSTVQTKSSSSRSGMALNYDWKLKIRFIATQTSSRKSCVCATKQFFDKELNHQLKYEKSISHCSGPGSKILLCHTANLSTIHIRSVVRKVCTISFEGPVNYLCDAWHVFPPKYEAWTHFNRP